MVQVLAAPALGLTVSDRLPRFKVGKTNATPAWHAAVNVTGRLTNAGGTISLIYSEEDAIVFSPTFQDTSRFTTAGKVIAASATGPKTWYLTGLTFDDGGQAIGSFVYVSVSNTYSQINIQTTAGNTLSATTYIAPYSPLSNSKNLTVIGAQTPVAGGRVLNLTLSSPLPGTGGSVNVSTASTSAEGTCVSATCAANGNVAFLGVLRNVTSGVLTTTRPAGYSRVVSQVVDGGAANVPGLGSVVTSVVPAHGVLVLPSTASSPVLTQAWARVDNAQSFAVSALVILKNANAAGDQQAAVYGDPLDTYSVAVPFDNTGGATNGLALVNPDPTQSATVYVIGYDSMGNVILNDSSISLPPLGHIAFVFAAQPGFSPLATGQGSIRVFAEPNVAAPAAPFHGINALLIKALPNLSYTNVSVVNR